MRRAEEGAKICGVFRVKNHDFTPKNHILFQFGPLDPPLYYITSVYQIIMFLIGKGMHILIFNLTYDVCYRT
jgi:hypothetical protein